jgi:hypothetical protein
MRATAFSLLQALLQKSNMLVGPFVCAGPAPIGSGQRNATMMPTAASISPVMIKATNQRAAIIVRPQKRSVFIFLIGLRGPGRLTSVKLPENAAFGPLIARAHSNEDTKGCERECRRSGLRYHEADTLCAISLNPSLLGMAGLYACFMRRFTRN